MSDEVDLANDMIARQVAETLKNRPSGNQRELLPKGYCQNPSCELDLEGDRLFCDAKCSSEYERQKKRMMA